MTRKEAIIPAAPRWMWTIPLMVISGVCLIPGSASGVDRSSKPTSSTHPSPTSPCDLQERAVDPNAGAPARLRTCLAAARCALVIESAKPLSLELLGIGTPDDRYRKTIDRGVRHLDCAASALQALPKAFDEETLRSAEDRIEMLRAFAKTFRALAGEGSSKEGRTRLTDACIGLALYVDDPVAEIAGAAKLWQGVAYRRAGRPERALQLLWPAIGDGVRNPVDFLMRAERCLALADLGRFPAALSLILRLEHHVEDWYRDAPQATRLRARDTLRWLRATIYHRWARALQADGKGERARAAEAEALKARGDLPSPPPPGRLLLLDETIVGLSDLSIDD